MQFESDYKLESGYTYYVTAKIRPTTKAYLEYQNGSYTGIGDKNTDEYLGTGKNLEMILGIMEHLQNKMDSIQTYQLM